MKTKKNTEIKLIDDKFRVDWDEKTLKCDFGIYFFEDKEITKFWVKLEDCGECDTIDDMVKLREALRKEWEYDNNIFKLIDIFNDNGDIIEVLLFLEKCMFHSIDVSTEVEYLKNKHGENVINRIKLKIKQNKDYRKQYITSSSSYLNYTKRIVEYKRILRLANIILNNK